MTCKDGGEEGGVGGGVQEVGLHRLLHSHLLHPGAAQYRAPPLQ